MKTNEIEHLDKTRYNVVKWLTTSYVFFYCPIMANYLINFLEVDKFYQVYVNTPILLAGVVLFQIFVIRLVLLLRKINSNPELKQILNDEYFIANQSKSFRLAFVVFIIVMCIAILLTSIFPKIPAAFVCYLIFFIVSMTALVSWLVYNRENK